MRVISKELLQALRERFKPGSRVELLKMDDVQAPPIGTRGTVVGVDDIGSIMVAWGQWLRPVSRIRRRPLQGGERR